jgi:hypothetical protein
MAVDDGEVEPILRSLLVRTLGMVRPASMLGFVRNVVPWHDAHRGA